MDTKKFLLLSKSLLSFYFLTFLTNECWRRRQFISNSFYNLVLLDALLPRLMSSREAKWKVAFHFLIFPLLISEKELLLFCKIGRKRDLKWQLSFWLPRWWSEYFISSLWPPSKKWSLFGSREKKGSLDFSLPLPSYIVFVGIGWIW